MSDNSDLAQLLLDGIDEQKESIGWVEQPGTYGPGRNLDGVSIDGVVDFIRLANFFVAHAEERGLRD